MHGRERVRLPKTTTSLLFLTFCFANGGYAQDIDLRALLPDVTFAKPSGWDAPVMIKSVDDCSAESCQYDASPFVFSEGDSIYLSYAFTTRNGAENVDVAPTLDGVRRGQFNSVTSEGVFYNIVIPPLQNLSPGNHTIGVKLDYDNTISESNESNNEYRIDLTITGSGGGDQVPAYILPHNSWRLISLPTSFASGSSITVHDFFEGDLPLGSYGTAWIIYYYDASNRQYVSPGLNDPLEQGVGYWIIQLTGSSAKLTVNDGAPTPIDFSLPQCPQGASGCFEFPLEAVDEHNWNLLGYPFPNNLAWNRQVIVTDFGSCADADGCTLNEASQKGVFHQSGYSFGDEGYNELRDSALLRPWMGYWALTKPAANGLNLRLLTPKFNSSRPILEIDMDENFDIHNYRAPFVVRANMDNGALFLLGSSHTSDFGSPTFKTVEAVFNSYTNIDFLIVEGVSPSVIHTQGYLNHVMADCESKTNNCVEGTYAVYLANIKGGIDFETGEPSEQAMLDHVIDRGYSENDYASLRYVRVINQLYRDNPNYSEADVIRGVERVQYGLIHGLGIASEFGYESWKNWYRQNIGRSLTMEEMHRRGRSTKPDSGGDMLEKLAYEVDQARNPNIKRTIDSAFQKGYHNILVVYGSGHIYEYYEQFSESAVKRTFLKYFE